MIRLNGSVFVNGDEVYFEDFEVGFSEELDLPFDYLDDDEEDYCDDDCEDCDLYEDEDEEDIDELVDELTEVYAEILSEGCFCPECTQDTLKSFLRDFIDLL